MHSKNHILQYIATQQQKEKTQKEVEQIHKYFEAYLKHLALTTLRLNGGKYKESRRYVSDSWIPCNIKMIQTLLLKLFHQNNNQQNWKKVVALHPPLRGYLELLFKYNIPIRNQLFHGNYYSFAEKEENLIFDIYLSSINAIEALIALKKKGKTILEHTPTALGATTGKKHTIGQLRTILNFQAATKGYKFEKAQQLYNSINKNDETKK
jgi:hypothetical protein